MPDQIPSGLLKTASTRRTFARWAWRAAVILLLVAIAMYLKARYDYETDGGEPRPDYKGRN